MKLRYIGIGAPAAPNRAPGSPQGTSFSRRGDLTGERRAEPFEKHHGGIRAHAEERRGAEVHVAGIATKDVPGGGQHDIREDDEGGEEEIFVDAAHRDACGGEHDHERDEPELHRPNSPWGLIPKTINRRPKATAGAQDAPKNMSTIDSEIPRISPAPSVPVMLPSPARTTTQNVRPM